MKARLDLLRRISCARKGVVSLFWPNYGDPTRKVVKSASSVLIDHSSEDLSKAFGLCEIHVSDLVTHEFSYRAIVSFSWLLKPMQSESVTPDTYSHCLVFCVWIRLWHSILHALQQSERTSHCLSEMKLANIHLFSLTGMYNVIVNA